MRLMNRVLIALAPLTLSACVIHLHVHDSPEGESEPAAASTPQETSLNEAVSGVVVDEQGRPIRARVAAVGSSGSIAMGTEDDGRFELSGLGWPEFSLHASTEDLVGVQTNVRPGTDGIQLVVRPAAAVTIDLQGVNDIRCAIFQGGARIEDFTLRPGKTARVAVPPGEIVVQVYEGEEVRAEHKARLVAGEQKQMGFGPLSDQVQDDS